MNTLDDRIIFFYSGQNVTGHTAGMYPYFIHRYRQVTSGSDIIFAGNFFYNGSDTSITFDVTDIIASDGYVAREDDFEGVYTAPNNIVNRYYMQIVWDNETINSSTQWVAKVYEYNNKNLQQYTTFFQPIGSYYNNWISILIQGFSRNDNKDSKLIPHYPMYTDEQLQSENSCPFGLSLLAGGNISGVSTVFEVDGEEYQESVSYERYGNITPSGNSFTFYTTVGNVADYRNILPTSDGTLYLTDRRFVTTFFNPDLQPDGGVWLYKRYPQGDRNAGIYLYRYSYVLINNSHNKYIDDASVDINDIDTTNILYTAKAFPDAFDEAYTSGGTEWIVGDDGEYRQTFIYKAAIFDVCPKRFYLFWQDRFGSFQCQGFNDYANYSENFERTEIQDYQNRRRNANIQVESKWKINSGWITEDLYPYYESIYTSPFLILYDSERDMRHTVMVNSNYEEKTYRNQKKMINMSLELTENKRQNILY